LKRAVESAGFTVPTPIQADAMPPALAGRDVMGRAQTGSGKTAAFVLPILQRLARAHAGSAAAFRATEGRATEEGPTARKKTRRPFPRALVLAPTRELAQQIGEVFWEMGRHLPLRSAVIYGGVGKQPQIDRLRRGIDILVATPGRLLDLMGTGHVRLKHIEVVVLDEADRMLDMGFIPDVKRIVAELPIDRQSLFFSATLPGPIVELAQRMLREPERIEIEDTVETIPSIDQRLLFVERVNKRALLMELLNGAADSRTLVFTRTKHGAQRLARQLSRGGVSADSLHGDKSQGARRKALDGFSCGRIRVLVATDIASRGLDVNDIAHVINYDLPYEPEAYVHRIGRTARAGQSGSAVSFCDETEVKQLRDIERLLEARVTVDDDHAYHSPETAGMRSALEPAQGNGGGNGSRRSARGARDRGGNNRVARDRGGHSTAARNGNRPDGRHSSGPSTGRRRPRRSRPDGGRSR